jgi:hypothetical protein
VRRRNPALRWEIAAKKIKPTEVQTVRLWKQPIKELTLMTLEPDAFGWNRHREDPPGPRRGDEAIQGL